MKIDHLRLFLAVARSGSLTGGARQFGLSQSAASQALAQLEQHTRIPLLDRSRRPLALTAAGERFKSGAENLLDDWDHVLADIRPAGSDITGTVSVAAIHSVGIHLLTPAMQRFAARHKGVRIRTQHLRHDMVLRAVRERRVDLGICSYPPSLRNLEVIPLREEPLVVVCHPAHRLVPRRRLKLADLAGQQLIAFDRDLPIRQAIDAALREAGVRPTVVMELDNIDTIKQVVLANCGLAILPEPMILRETLNRLLVALPIEDHDLRRPIAAIHHRAYRDPAAEALIGFLRECLDTAVYSAPVAPLRHQGTPTPHE